MERLDTAAGVSHFSTQKEIKHIHATGLQRVYDQVESNAEAIGMSVNEKKTQLICINSAINSEINVYINGRENKIENSEELKIVGYKLGKKPGPAANVKFTRRKYAAKAWNIRHLKKAGLDNNTLLKVYKMYVRPTLEYAVPAFNDALTCEQKWALERCQMLSLKTILGFSLTYEQCLKRSGIESLEERRNDLVKNFAIKAYQSERFGYSWFPPRQLPQYNLRRRNLIHEENTNCYRLKKSPIFAMRALLNDQENLPERNE